MIYSGLVSVTFKNLSPREIVDLVSRAGLAAIEWGGDIHVPHGDVTAARTVALITADAGLRVAAYGSYYRLGELNSVHFQTIVETAIQLGAPTIRVWAGRRSSREADESYRASVITESRRIADLAASAGMTVSYEYHGNTLMDTNASALQLLTEVQHPAVRTFWQPPVGASEGYCLEGLNGILPWLTSVHVFHWTSTKERKLLKNGEDSWRMYLETIEHAPPDIYAMIEFVKDDLPTNFMKDAAVLKTWLQPV